MGKFYRIKVYLISETVVETSIYKYTEETMLRNFQTAKNRKSVHLSRQTMNKMVAVERISSYKLCMNNLNTTVEVRRCVNNE